ncbi:MAG: dTDP-4-dehydrorhamnose 3,5-epimerase family protein [Candidatus Omnitrophica bacterium]|nr:dTDP-4-dehydrorhamnose 3,5-epimerase family protein [Candidatus Omnitrophota bacterium]
MIKGVNVKKLKIIRDDRGRLMEILRSDDKVFKKFGQVYMTTAYPGVVKAWHFHQKQNDNFACVHGKIRLALYDARKNSPTYREVNEFILSTDDPILVTIPKMVYHGFKGIADCESIVINTPTLPYNYKKPDEERIDAYDNDIKYDWKK